MRKTKWFLDYAKEESWLNKMAAEGWRLLNYNGFTYEFAPKQPTIANYRIDYRTFKNQMAYEEYKALFADSGWIHVCGKRNSGAQYFLATTEDTDADIFSDYSSKAGRIKRMLQGWITAIFPVWIALFFTNFYTFDVYTIFHPKELYLTPGLWERTGFDFWFGFLFETPFAILRGYAWAIPLIMLFVISILALRLLYVNQRQSSQQF